VPEFFQAVHAQVAVVSVGENTYGHPQISFDKREGFSFAGDSAGLPGFVQGTPNYPVNLAPNASGAGSDTGFSQTGGGIDYAIPYNGLRLQYFVQVDAVQVGDRIDISSGSAPGIFAPQSLSIFFRGDGSGNASLFNGSVDTAIQTFLPAFNTGITGAGQWYNYAVRYNMPGHEIRQRARVFHITAGHAGADDQTDLLVFIEGRRCLGRNGARPCRCHDGAEQKSRAWPHAEASLTL